MFSYMALLSCMFLVAVLFIWEQKRRPMTSWGLWVALLWILIIGSRYISAWSGVDIELDSSDVLLDGSPLDRNIFIGLIIAGGWALLKRKPDWNKIFHSNRWFYAFFIYCGISIIWSDYPFVSFKRWAKELGNVIMVLVIVTEVNPLQAIKAVFIRYVYLVIPLSLLLIYFFPQYGTYYGDDNWTLFYSGIATNKNKLGVITSFSSLFLIWDLIHVRDENRRGIDWIRSSTTLGLLVMAGWLIFKAHSATALLCLVMGVFSLVFMKHHYIVRQVRYLGTYSLLVVSLAALLLNLFPGILDFVTGIVGRDKTFTGRTDLWLELLTEPINPLLGTGYQSFWLGTRADFLWEKYLFHPIQAHNGYIETYLNGGLIGVGLLVALILATGSKLKKVLLIERSFGILMITLLLAAIFYNFTEAMISRHSLLWFILSVAALYSPPQYGPMSRNSSS